MTTNCIKFESADIEIAVHVVPRDTVVFGDVQSVWARQETGRNPHLTLWIEDKLQVEATGERIEGVEFLTDAPDLSAVVALEHDEAVRGISIP